MFQHSVITFSWVVLLGLRVWCCVCVSVCVCVCVCEHYLVYLCVHVCTYTGWLQFGVWKVSLCSALPVVQRFKQWQCHVISWSKCMCISCTCTSSDIYSSKICIGDFPWLLHWRCFVFSQYMRSCGSWYLNFCICMHTWHRLLKKHKFFSILCAF